VKRKSKAKEKKTTCPTKNEVKHKATDECYIHESDETLA
jgi:hypothetical protein